MPPVTSPLPLLPTSSPPIPATAPVSLEAVAGLLRGLDRAQRRAVTHGDGPLLVLAGPGTGKTRVVTHRIAWLIATKRARPEEILALTFTEKAADEMQARVDRLVPYGQAGTAIHTFHAFGDRLIRDHAFELGLPGEPRVLGRAEAVVLLGSRMEALGLRLRGLRAAARGGLRHRSRRAAGTRVAAPARPSRRARGAAGALSVPARRRVSGHEPGPARPAASPRRARAQRGRGGRRRPGHLRLPRCRAGEPARLRPGLSGGAHGRAATQPSL